MSHRCLVIGASGQLGRALCGEFLASRYEVVESANRAPQPGQWHIDLSDPSATVATLGEIKPDWILIAGALGNVDRAETEPERCFSVNVEGPRAIAEAARTHGWSVVYYSTDAVFDGTKEWYVESDPVSPVNIYSHSKVQGEVALRTLLPDRSLVIRTAWLYGPDEGRRNFVLRLVDDLRAGRPVQVPMDQWGSPTYTEDVACATRVLLERGCQGTFHAVGPDVVNRLALAKSVCQQFGLDKHLLEAKETAVLRQVAKRPLQVRLDCGTLRAVDSRPFRTLSQGLAALKAWDTALVT